jgi:hypothetical protein
MAGLRIADSSGATVAISTRGQKVSREGAVTPCVMRVMMDGILMSESKRHRQRAAVDVYAVEVFYGPRAFHRSLRGPGRRMVRIDRDLDSLTAGTATRDQRTAGTTTTRSANSGDHHNAISDRSPMTGERSGSFPQFADRLW